MKKVKALETPGVDGADLDAKRAAAYDRAVDYQPGRGDDKLTDLASVPSFLRWFVNSYGKHTLAAIIHDDQIAKKRDTGSLGSDVVADRLFREMLRACGTPMFMSWVMWTAVALRTRWNAGGRKRAQLLGWAATSAAGMGGTALLFATGRRPWALLWAAVTIAIAGLLWGRQWGAAVVAAISLPLMAPAAALVLVARFGLWVLDELMGGGHDSTDDKAQTSPARPDLPAGHIAEGNGGSAVIELRDERSEPPSPSPDSTKGSERRKSGAG